MVLWFVVYLSAYVKRGTTTAVVFQGDVLFVRFFEGPASGIDRQGPPPSNPKERVQKNAEALIDIPIIMQTMKVAIQKAVAQNTNSENTKS